MIRSGNENAVVVTIYKNKLKIVAANYALVDMSYSSSQTANVYEKSSLAGRKYTYVHTLDTCMGIDAALSDTAQTSSTYSAKVTFAGMTGWMDINDVEITPLIWTKAASSYTVSSTEIRHNYVNRPAFEYSGTAGILTTEDISEEIFGSIYDEYDSPDVPEIEIPSLDGYATEEWVNNKNYATEYDLKTIDYSSINNVPVSEDGTGELNITDESGNIGMKVTSEAVYAKDFVASSGALNDALSRIAQLEETITDLLNRIQTLEEANS